MGRTSWKFVGAGASAAAVGPSPAPVWPWQTAHCVRKMAFAVAAPEARDQAAALSERASASRPQALAIRRWGGRSRQAWKSPGRRSRVIRSGARSENERGGQIAGAGVRATAAGPSPRPSFPWQPAQSRAKTSAPLRANRSASPTAERGVPDRGLTRSPGNGAVAEHPLPHLFLAISGGQRSRTGQARQPGVPPERIQVVHQVERRLTVGRVGDPSNSHG